MNEISIPAAALVPCRVLESLGIQYRLLTHARANSMELCRGIGEEYGAKHCKNLFLTNRGGTIFKLLMMEDQKPFHTSAVSRSLGVSRLSFADSEQLKSVLGLEPGFVSVMGLVNHCAREAAAKGMLEVVIDGDLLERELICVHPNTDTATLVISTGDLKRFISEIGFRITVIEI